MKKLASLLMVIMLFICFLCGCSNITNEEKEQTREAREIKYLDLSSQMIWLEKFDGYSGLCYDKDTKIIYMYSSNLAYNSANIVSYSPYYVMDVNNNPIIAIYNGDE